MNMSDDVIYTLQDNPGQLTDEYRRNFALVEIKKYLFANGSSLSFFSPMPVPDDSVISDDQKKQIIDETSYNRDELLAEHAILHMGLNEDQLLVYNRIMRAIDIGNGGVFFLYGSGGTGKTYIWKTLCSGLRGRVDIVILVASSGIALLLLPRGRTAHSRFGIPLQVDESSTCGKIKLGSELAGLLKRMKLIIWDEAPMTNRHCFKALDKSLMDIIRSPNGRCSKQPFGGLVVVFGGNFRQILPVVPNGSRHDIVHASISSSRIWDSCQVLKLTKNMRLHVGSSNSNASENREFAEWLLTIGDGIAGDPNDGEVDVELPQDILIRDVADPIAAIVDSTYPSLMQNRLNMQFFNDGAILASTNEMVEKINDYVLSLLPGKEVVYMSSDNICKAENGDVEEQEEIFSTELLNEIKCSGLPNHIIKLKVGCIVMLLRNIDQSRELCNGMRLIVTKLTTRVIEAQILSGKNIGQKVLIGRMILSASDTTKFPVRLQRKQSPMAICYAMTINKSQ